FVDGKLTEKARVSMYFNGQKVHDHVQINQVWGGPNSGVDGGNDGGKGITDSRQGLKLQCEGHDVRYRNTWIKELHLTENDTSFTR
ncbi:MAG: family 16 glycoside hydrolase, partial [Fuerstiella sp.]